MIPLAEPTLDGNEARYVQECIESGYVSSVGPFVDRFEREFAAAIGAKHAVACSSGTAALHVALLLAGAGPGKLVAVSDFTFIASANAISYTGADLLLVDSEMETWNMDTELLYDEVVRRAKRGQQIPDIVEIVHILGHPAMMDPLLELRDRFGITIVEDAAESLGASWCAGPLAGKQVGTVGEFGCFSFNGNKIITTGGGGMIVTDDAEQAARAKHLTTQAKLPGPDYVHDAIGFNYRLTNIAAALGVAQLENLPNKIAAKYEIRDRYHFWLATLPIRLPPDQSWAKSTFWMYSLVVDSSICVRQSLIDGMALHHVQVRSVWSPLHRQRPYGSAQSTAIDVATRIGRNGISLPSSTHITGAEQRFTAITFSTLLCAAAGKPEGAMWPKERQHRRS